MDRKLCVRFGIITPLVASFITRFVINTNIYRVKKKGERDCQKGRQTFIPHK
jgi:hypothetical protein